MMDVMPHSISPYAAPSENDNHPVSIYVVGPSSTGKSTLCDAIVKDTMIHPLVYIKEVARTVMKTQGFSREDVGSFEMQFAIMNAQLRAENDAFAKFKSFVPKDSTSGVFCLSDRSAVDPIAYAMSSTIAGAENMAMALSSDPGFKAVLPRYRKSVFVLLTPVPEWIKDDGVRSLKDPWRNDDNIHRVLQDLDIPFREIGPDVKDIRDRVRLVRQWVTGNN